MSDKAGRIAKPLRADARRNRDHVLAVAREMLSAEGSSASFDEIARRAGVGVGTVYRHFPTRNALFEAVVVGRVEEFTERARALAGADSAPESAFCAFFAHLVGEVALNQALCEALDGGDGTAIVIPSRLRRDFVESFGSLLAHAKKAGEIRSDVDIHDVLDLLIGMAGAEHRARLRGAPGTLITVALDGLRSPAPSAPGNATPPRSAELG
ncbi:putative transcriptional regulator, TetR family [Nocardia nova SH22a]|uniref:Putative transcriptional regulator, TetR family n=1 Tax=Nocardia nova SH22a TaxID=1415166 RepID=W5TC66_9NOCA|nr:TetR/AcrR family transcriptional regulator [Nocardia nova]AHH16832.1 putative transcriptional regulator, TetR family [Nocardia nova SH22a]